MIPFSGQFAECSQTESHAQWFGPRAHAGAPRTVRPIDVLSVFASLFLVAYVQLATFDQLFYHVPAGRSSYRQFRGRLVL